MKTVSLELSKELCKAGYPQEASFYWKFSELQRRWICVGKRFTKVDRESNEKLAYPVFASPTADEILDSLPERLDGYKTIGMGKSMGEWIVGYQKIDNKLQAIRGIDKSLADAVARLWLYLKENNLLDKEINK